MPSLAVVAKFATTGKSLSSSFLFVPYLFFCGKYSDKFEQITIVVFVEDAVLMEDVVNVFEWFCAETSEASFSIWHLISESQSRILHYLPFPVSPHPSPFSISPGWNLIFFRKKLFFLPDSGFLLMGRDISIIYKIYNN